MSTLHKKDFTTIMFTKGALDQIIQRCDRILIHQKVVLLSKNDKDKILNIADEMAENALRVLALAYKETTILDENHLIFIGLVGRIDPPRKEAIASIKRLKKAGIAS